jgi:hypothetical protein
VLACASADDENSHYRKDLGRLRVPKDHAVGCGSISLT